MNYQKIYTIYVTALGSKHWFINGLRHRLDGPAIEWSNGYKEWYVNDLLHRIDGPAVENADGTKGWYIHGEHINCETNEEFLRIVKLKAFW